MAASKRRIGIYTTVGIGLAIIIIAAVFASGIQVPTNSPSGSSKEGTLVVSIKDAPVNLKELWITVDGLYIQNAKDDSWIELELSEDQPINFDLLTLTGDKSLQLSQETVAAGDYSKIRIEVTKAIATYTDNKGENHQDQELKVPPGHIDIITNFNVGDSQVTGLMIDMQPDTAAISQSGNFKPILKTTVTPIVSPNPTASPTTSPTVLPSPS